LTDDEPARCALETLSADDRVELGIRRGRHVAATLETSSPQEDKLAWHWINELPGVRHVDVVFVSLEGTSEEAGSAD
jgi:hypothetical protein